MAMTQSLEEFKASTLIVDVIEGRGKSGHAKTGPTRWLVDGYKDPGGIGKLFTFAAHLFDHCQPSSGFISQTEREPWMRRVVCQILDGVGKSELCTWMAPDGRHLVLVTNRSPWGGYIPDDEIIRTLHAKRLKEQEAKAKP